jgi:hypothetical protein
MIHSFIGSQVDNTMAIQDLLPCKIFGPGGIIFVTPPRGAGIR